MTQITAALVKELREKSDAGMMDCKKALSATDGDLEAAMDWLRTKGLAKAAKKSSRTAKDGLVTVKTDGLNGSIVEINAETDFVARNEEFQEFVQQIGALALTTNGELDALNATEFTGKGKPVSEALTDLIATIGENMNLRRVAKLSVNDGIVASYMHGALKPGLGKIGVLVALESTGDKDALNAVGKQIAMHVAAARPEALNIADVDADNLEREKAVLSEQARASGKPEEIIEKMVEGRLRKYYEEIVLNEQVFVVDGESKIKAVVEKAAKDIGAAIELKGFVRFELGDGIVKEESDFAQEVAAAMAS